MTEDSPAIWSQGPRTIGGAMRAGTGVRLVFGLVALVILLVPLRDLVTVGPNIGGAGGVDYRLYMDAAARWLGGGSFYQAYQSAPYVITPGDILYPPVALWLFVPFTFLPAVLWWVIPIGVTTWAIWRLRPDPIVWPFMALCLAWPPTVVKLATGNPVMWSVAALALGVVYYWPAVFVLLKPSLFPFALFGANRHRWWLALGAFVLLSLPFGGMWLDWVGTVVNSRGGGLAYSVQEVPLLALPLVAWLGHKKTPAHSPDKER